MVSRRLLPLASILCVLRLLIYRRAYQLHTCALYIPFSTASSPRPGLFLFLVWLLAIFHHFSSYLFLPFLTKLTTYTYTYIYIYKSLALSCLPPLFSFFFLYQRLYFI